MVRECKEPRPPIIYYWCGKEGHIASRCNQGSGRGGAAASEPNPLGRVKALPSSLPVAEVLVGGRVARALVDTGCSTTVLASEIVGEYKGEEGRPVAVDGREIRCEGT